MTHCSDDKTTASRPEMVRRAFIREFREFRSSGEFREFREFRGHNQSCSALVLHHV